MNAIDTTVGSMIPELRKDVGKYAPIYYAAAGGDFNPIHIDPEMGKMLGLGGNILQGLCTMAYVTQGVTDWIGDPTKLRKIKVRFESVVRPNDTVIVKGKVAGKEGDRVNLEIWAENQEGVKVISNANAVVEIG